MKIPLIVLGLSLLSGCSSGRDLPTAIGAGFAPLAIGTTVLPSGEVGVVYTQNLSASGGNGVYSWGLAEGSLPTGLSLSSSGNISGTPTEADSFGFIVQVNSGDGQATTQQLTIDVFDPPAPASRLSSQRF